jgi:2-(1,2-epoxy-1,2-dihydrophenyl)acetyl-CoA isomerase
VVAADAAIRCVVVTAQGPHFCVGGDLVAFTEAADPSRALARIAGDVHAGIMALRSSPGVVITAAAGAVAGAGLGLLLAGDLRLVADDVSIVAAYGPVGLSPDCGVSWGLPRSVGPARAAEMLLLGRRLDASTALDWGLVNRVVTRSDLAREADAAVAAVLAVPAGASARTVRQLRWPRTRLGDQLDVELSDITDLVGTPEAQERMRRFLGV